MRFPRQRGSTSVMIRVFIPHSLSTVGAGCTGLTYASTNLAVAYSRELQNGFTQITGANLVAIATPGAWVNPGTGKLGFAPVDATNYPGLYEIQFPDNAAAFGAGDLSQNIIINIIELTTTVLNIGPNGVMIPLVPWNYQDGAAMGLTNLDVAVSSRATVATILAGNVEDSVTVAHAMQAILAACAGKSDGGGSATIHFRNQADSKNRITATVDSNGDRTAITLSYD